MPAANDIAILKSVMPEPSIVVVSVLPSSKVFRLDYTAVWGSLPLNGAHTRIAFAIERLVH